MAADSNVYQSVLQVSYYVHCRCHVRVVSFIPSRFILHIPILVTVHGLISIFLNFSFTYSIIYSFLCFSILC